MRAPEFVTVVLLSGIFGFVAAEEPQPKQEKKYTGAPAGRMVFYAGMVQGVGFRATAAKIAQDFPVTGWVKNLNDGRVQLLAEGPGDAVDAFLKAIRAHWKESIQKEEVQEQPVSGKFKKFMVVVE